MRDIAACGELYRGSSGVMEYAPLGSGIIPCDVRRISRSSRAPPVRMGNLQAPGILAQWEIQVLQFYLLGEVGQPNWGNLPQNRPNGDTVNLRTADTRGKCGLQSPKPTYLPKIHRVRKGLSPPPHIECRRNPPPVSGTGGG